jgi:N-acyl-D-amino-acid deacylase
LRTKYRMKEEIDLLIRNGLVFDGTGSQPFEADIAISDDSIAFIRKKTVRGGGEGIKSNRTVDAKGMAVTPGFIDTHAHSEFTLLADSRAEGKIHQGITTEINGNCGLSAAPLFGEASEQREEDLRDLDLKERWSTLTEYFEILRKRRIPHNFVTLAGHGNIRACVAGYEDRQLTAEERKKMKALLMRTVREGAIGLSTGLIYPPGVYSDTEELVELARCANKLIYTSHMRSEGDRLIESVDEVITIAKRSGIKVHISHIKTSGVKNWKKIDDVARRIEEAKKENVRITCDRYPYIASSTDLDTLLPSWAYEGGAGEELVKLKTPALREKIKKQILSEHAGTKFWQNIYVSSVSSERSKWMEGKSLAYVANRRNSGPVDTLLEILVEEKLRVGAIFLSMSEGNLIRFLSLPCIMIGTDSSARSASGITRRGKPHPRGFGSFPRFLGRYVRDKALLGMSEAIHKITMLPAETFGIRKRGVLKKGAFADIVVFDPERIADRATFENPFLKPQGIHCVIVNGVPAVWEGQMTGNMSGRILKHGR